MKKWILLVAMGALGSLPGCALTTDTIHIQYNSAAAPSRIEEAGHVTVNVRAIEGRSGRPDQVSSKKNGYGMEMAAILSDRPVLQIVQQAISEELRNVGFQTGAGSVVVVAEVNKFSNDYKVGFWSATAAAEVTLAIQVRDRADHIVYARTLTGQGTNGGVVIMGGENARVSLESALSATVVPLMSDPAFTRAVSEAGGSVRRRIS
jgi:hypothetical protein